jgi:LPXTG-site transpeptidase (sortase) family protein
MTHRNINNVLTVLVIVLAVFILIAPFLGQLDWFWNGPGKTAEPRFVLDYKNSIESKSSVTPANQLYIPAAGASAEILEGNDIVTVDRGLWHRPATPTPLEQGNSVIVGHRFSFDPRVVQPLYHLDKVNLGDDIFVFWEGKTVKYNVTEKKVVKASAVEVEAPTKNTQLTLYTCTPLWNPVDRLVIIAKPAGAAQ